VVPVTLSNNRSGARFRPRGADGMQLPMTTLRKFVKDESGATAVEYGLIAAGISMSIIAVVHGLGAKLFTAYTSVSTAGK